MRCWVAARLPATLALVSLGLNACGGGEGGDAGERIFNDPNLPIEQRVDNLVAQMTLDEKIAALGTDPSVERLGIRGSEQVEGLHGLALGGPARWGGTSPIETTQFPQAVGLGETWDPEILREVAAVVADEARYTSQSAYHRGGLVVRGPNVDLARDPRWGRFEESYGEDPFLAGTLGTAFVQGLHGDDPRYWKASSILKHFMANSNENFREESSSDFGERLMREYYSVPFRMAIEQGGARGLFTAYNAVNGIPMVAHPLLRSMVIGEWGFDGIICSDAGGLLYSATRHRYFPNHGDAAAAAIRAGTNQFLRDWAGNDDYAAATREALSRGILSEAELDEALKGVYRVMIRLGTLDPPEMVPYSAIGEGPEPWTDHERRRLVRRVTQKSVVLLKNNGLLPLDRHRVRSIALVGEYAQRVLLDWYSGTPPYAVSPWEGIRSKVGPGVPVVHPPLSGVARAAAVEDVVILVLGNHPWCNSTRWGICADPSEGREAVDRRSITLQDEDLVRAAVAANPRTVLVLRSSFPYAINWSQANVPAIIHMANNSQEEGNALADVLFGDANPGGRLTTTWPRSLADVPPMMDYNLRHGRTYMYSRSEPLYPFGHGLSYTTFAYSNLRASSNRLSRDGSIAVSVDVANTGDRSGDEVVQMYVRYPASRVARPRRELKGFARVTLERGVTRTVTLALRARDLAYYDGGQGRFVVEPGEVIVEVGSSSADIRAELTIVVGG